MNKLLALTLSILSSSTFAATATMTWSGKIPEPNSPRNITVTQEQVSWDANGKRHQYSLQDSHPLPHQVEVVKTSETSALVIFSI